MQPSSFAVAGFFVPARPSTPMEIDHPFFACKMLGFDDFSNL